MSDQNVPGCSTKPLQPTSKPTPMKILVSPNSLRSGQNKKLRPSFLAPKSTMVTILIGPEKSEFVVHQEFLTFHSEYFRACLEGNFAEATTKIVELDDTTEKAFGHVVNWIYTQTVEKIPKTIGNKNPALGPLTVSGIKVGEYVDTWILADYLQIPHLQNAIMDELGSIHFKRFLLKPDMHEFLQNLYNRTTSGSLLRSYWVDRFSKFTGDWFESFRTKIPTEMVFEILLRLRNQVKNDDRKIEELRDEIFDLRKDRPEDSDSSDDDERMNISAYYVPVNKEKSSGV